MRDADRETSVAGAILFMLIGPIAWAGHFLLVYGGQAALCAFQNSGIFILPQIYGSVLVVAVTVLVGAQLTYAAWKPESVARILRFDADEHDSQVFASRVMRLLTLLSLFGVFWAGAAAFFIDACGLGR
nr:hypothetical protein REQ54_04750 [Rhizobium sp. Q54]